MSLGQRHKQRLLTTIVTVNVFLACFLLFFLLSRAIDLEMTLILTFLAGIVMLTGYQVHHYRYCHEHTTIVNTLTQIYAGTILTIALLLILLLRWLFGVEVGTSYIILSAIVILLVFLTLGRYDEFLESHVPHRLRHVQRQVKR